MRVHLKQHEQGRIVGRSVKSSLQPHGSTGLQVLSGEGGQLVTTDGQVLQVGNSSSDSSYGINVRSLFFAPITMTQISKSVVTDECLGS